MLSSQGWKTSCKDHYFVKGVAAEIRTVAALYQYISFKCVASALKPHQFMCTMTVSSLSLSFMGR